MKKLIAGNWKMNGTLDSSAALARSIDTALKANEGVLDRCDFLVCPPYVYLQAAKGACGINIALGGQDCSSFDNGAYTGDVSVEMLKDIGAAYVILGHSERRQHFKESDALIAAKAKKAHEAGLVTIICVGETEAERDAGQEKDVVGSQLAQSMPDCATAQNTVIAYEPVWAIGTGKTASSDDIQEMHAFIREKLDNNGDFRILYGGSVKPGNAAEILHIENVDGALIGGASLKAEDFLGIAQAA